MSGTAEVAITGLQEPVFAPAASVSRDFLRVMGVQPVQGRAFLPEEQRLGGAPAAGTAPAARCSPSLRGGGR